MTLGIVIMWLAVATEQQQMWVQALNEWFDLACLLCLVTHQEKNVPPVANGILRTRGAQLIPTWSFDTSLADLQKQGSASSSMSHEQGK